MKALFRTYRDLPRKKQTAVHLIAAALVLIVTYFTMGCLPFTAEEAFRRREQSMFAGPMEILADAALPDGEGTRVILASDKYFNAMYLYTPQDRSSFVLKEKHGPLTVAVIQDWFQSSEGRADPPLYSVVLYDDYPKARRAELELTVSDEEAALTCELEAVREWEGCFLFHADSGVLSDLSSRSFGLFTSDESCAYTAVVRLYDWEGTLLCETALPES